MGQALTVVRPNFRLLGVTPSYRWLRDGSVIPGETGSSYLLGPADEGTRVSAEVTGTESGYSDSVVTTPAILVGPIGGTATAFGQLTPLLIVPTPTDVAGSAVEPMLVYHVDFAATGAQYALQVSSPVSTTLGNYAVDSRGTLTTALPWAVGAGTQTVDFLPAASGVASDPVDVPVARRTPTASLKLSTYSARRSTSVKATVTIGNWSPLKPTGTITIKSGSTVLARLQLTALKPGVVAVYLRKFGTTGIKRITAVYSGDSNYLPRASSTRILRITY